MLTDKERELAKTFGQPTYQYWEIIPDEHDFLHAACEVLYRAPKGAPLPTHMGETANGAMKELLAVIAHLQKTAFAHFDCYYPCDPNPLCDDGKFRFVFRLPFDLQYLRFIPIDNPERAEVALDWLIHTESFHPKYKVVERRLENYSLERRNLIGAFTPNKLESASLFDE